MFGLPSTAAEARPLGAVSLLASLEALASSPCRELSSRPAVAVEVPAVAAAEVLVEPADLTLAEAAMEAAEELAAGLSR